MATTKWLPDTCECGFNLLFDDVSGELVEAQLILPPCPLHAHIPVAEIYPTIIAENRSKNLAMQAVDESLPEGVSPTGWEFDENRELIVTIPEGHSLPDAQTAAESASTIPVTVTT
jgi:hypothetical protein